MTPARVDIVIDELVLHGFAPGDRHAVAEALQRELAALLAAPDTAFKTHDAAVVDGGTLPAGPPDAVGVAAARAVAGGLRP